MEFSYFSTYNGRRSYIAPINVTRAQCDLLSHALKEFGIQSSLHCINAQDTNYTYHVCVTPTEHKSLSKQSLERLFWYVRGFIAALNIH